MTGEDPRRQDKKRLDQWLWQARFFRSRSLAAQHCAAGRVRCDGAVVAKPSHIVRPGSVLTFVQGRHIRVVKVLAIGERRGPAAEAQSLYEDLAPPSEATRLAPDGQGLRDRGGGRPTKRQRRDTDRLRRRE